MKRKKQKIHMKNTCRNYNSSVWEEKMIMDLTHLAANKKIASLTG